MEEGVGKQGLMHAVIAVLAGLGATCLVLSTVLGLLVNLSGATKSSNEKTTLHYGPPPAPCI